MYYGMYIVVKHVWACFMYCAVLYGTVQYWWQVCMLELVKNAGNFYVIVYVLFSSVFVYRCVLCSMAVCEKVSVCFGCVPTRSRVLLWLEAPFGGFQAFAKM